MRPRTAILAASLLLAACGPDAQGPAERRAGAPATAAPVPGARTVSLAVGGMTWPLGCPPRVQGALRKIDGVAEVDVSFRDGTAEVTLDQDADVSHEALCAALEEAGFEGLVREDP